jgi:hypothetical protein
MRLTMMLVLLTSTLAGCSGDGAAAGEAEAAGEVAPPTRAAGPPAAGDEAEILAVVDRLFEAFQRRDPAIAAEVLVPEGVFYAIDAGTGTLGTQTADQFFASLARPGAPLIERIFDPVVMVHGNVGMVWGEYDFRVGDAFSHCGMDLFSFGRIAGEWKMTAATYTVEREGCPQR